MNKQNMIDTLNGVTEEIYRLTNNIKYGYEPKGKDVELICSYPHMVAPKVLESLTNIGIKTVKDLSRYKEDRLRELPGIGPESIRKLSILLECHGRRFKN